MTPALLLGVATGLGLWLILAAVRPRPAPLAHVLASLWAPAQPAVQEDAAGRLTAWMLRLLSAVGARTTERDQQLALAARTPESWARDKVIGVIAGVAFTVLVWIGLAAAGVRLPAVVSALSVAGAAGGWLLPDLRLREEVERRRKAFRHALSAYLDLVNVILAGGGGLETALVAAADAGDGWAFGELRHALHRARRINQPLWTAFDDLGSTVGIGELRDIASSIGLAGAQGARIRASLSVKADTLRAHQIAETETQAEATTERMNLPTAVLLLGFLLFIVFPAVTAITATGSRCTAASGTVAAECPDNDTTPPPIRSNP